MDRFAIKGHILWSDASGRLNIRRDSYLLCGEDGCCAGVEARLPGSWSEVSVADHSGRLIIPGLVDLHLHAPQYGFCGTGMDLELLEWLETQVFPEEARYQDLDYAREAYECFARRLKRSATTRACIFASLHVPATELLMEILEKTGLEVLVGKVSMDRNCPDYLREESPETAERDVRQWLERTQGRFQRVRPILTPRFIPSCSDRLMEGLGRIQRETVLSVQSHLSENPGEVAWVKELCPWAETYGDAYDRFGLLGGPGCRTIMAHCVYSGEQEQQLMKERGVWIAHCPSSNTNLSSGIAPVREFLDRGLKVGLGSDVSGGSTESMFRVLTEAIQVSKLYWRLVDPEKKPLTFEEAFAMATLGGGSFFGKVGSFEPGYQLDALVLDDTDLNTPAKLDERQRLERICYLGDERQIAAKVVGGEWVLGTEM